MRAAIRSLVFATVLVLGSIGCNAVLGLREADPMETRGSEDAGANDALVAADAFAADGSRTAFGEPVPLADGLDGLVDIAVGPTHVYWAERGDGSEAKGVVRRTEKTCTSDACAPTLVRGGLASLQRIVLQSDELLVGTGGAAGRIIAKPLEGAAERVFTEAAYLLDLQVDDDKIYFSGCSDVCSRWHPFGVVRGLERATFAPSFTFARLGVPLAITGAGKRVAWIDIGPTDAQGAVGSSLIATREAIPIASEQSSPTSVVAHAGHVYWATRGTGPHDGALWEATLDGASSSAVPLVSGRSSPRGLVAGEDGLYWVDEGTPPAYDDGSVDFLPYGSKEPITIAQRRRWPYALAIDPTSIYWIDRGTPSDDPRVHLVNGAVLKTARAP